MYILEVNEGSHLFKKLDDFKDKYVNRFEHYGRISNILTGNYGFEHYEVSNFCRNGEKSRHNQCYWEGNRSFGAFGMGATSFVNGLRVTRPKSLKKYYDYVDELTKDGSPANLSKFIEIHDERNKNESLKWIILSRLRRAQGISWS